ncbi:10 kDa heat shock protein, mitochondrial OS=Schizosaccharomyces pombe (strain 972 / ATCC 24843) GN=hsp10 PE=1 SV=1 [Rhizoctonia solani AG-1 IB]|uniref:10 kDa heat shock protein, mitochondrial n=1 Tax=Thanatephorus cucumeris (strain AG1-IB / isolate 7/3/14) TaxID=1108050 RepID=A0A0B7FY78_THACB|nr:10 kDa heat shock protein, mitochondrial OS=Schizosaccharomyces pombe (strain 972 / ATCC 24843) GN=hsp10 PE=1 SV=1 [Rhizoctonia solani AG-1 IB]
MDVVRKIPALLSRATFLMRTNSDKLDLGKFRDFLYSSTIMASQVSFKSIKAVVPLLDRVLVQRFKPDTKTASGIFLPSSATSSPLPEATVIAVGPGALNKKGDVIPPSVKRCI